MRIKSFEIIISLTMITTSILSLNSDQSYFKGFPVYHWVEYVILAVGFLLPICAWLLRTSKKDVTAEQEKTNDMRVFICPQCETASSFAEVRNKMCPQCNIKMEPLDGFYDRHPEMK